MQSFSEGTQKFCKRTQRYGGKKSFAKEHLRLRMLPWFPEKENKTLHFNSVHKRMECEFPFEGEHLGLRLFGSSRGGMRHYVLLWTLEMQCEFPFEWKPKVSWGNGNVCERIQIFSERTLKILGERKSFVRENSKSLNIIFLPSHYFLITLSL